MREPGEPEIIRLFQERFGNHGFVPEDVEVAEVGGRSIIMNTDTFVQSTDMPPGMGLADAARKSMVACVSDFAAKGVRPAYAVVSVNIPGGTSRTDIGRIAAGLDQASREYGVRILGGDTNGGRELVLNVCMIGSGGIVRRGGAAAGDRIFATGLFGYAALGLRILQGRTAADGAVERRAVGAFLRPEPRLEFGVRNHERFSSAMDSSDGLSTTLVGMAGQSMARFVIERLPADGDLAGYAGGDLPGLVLHGGEEYEFVFTAARRHASTVIDNARESGVPLTEIGRVESGEGVMVRDRDGYVRLQDMGWRHM